MVTLRNIFRLPDTLPPGEYFEDIAMGDAKVERIISSGHITPADDWYDQETDELVILLEGEAKLIFEDNEEVLMKRGDYLLIKAHEKHRVTYTSEKPACIWLAVHGNLNMPVKF